MQSTTNQNVAKDKRVSKLVAKAFRALNSAEAAMLDKSGGEQGFTPAERNAFESIMGAKDSLCSTLTWKPFVIRY